MNRRLSVLNGLLLVAVVVLAVAVWWQNDEVEAWRRKVTEAEHRIARQSADAGASVAGLTTPGKPLRPGASVVAAGTVATPDGTGKQSQAPTPEAAERARIIAAHRQHQEELNALNGYADGFMALQLPAVTVERAKQIILSQQQALEAARNAASTAAPAGRASAMDAYKAVLSANEQSQKDQLSALLGEGVYEHLEAYHRQSAIDWAVGTDLWDAGVPLSGEQLHALALAEVQTHYERQNPFEAATASRLPDPVTGLSPQDVALLARSSRFLSPAQQGALRQSLIEDHQYNAAMAGFSAKQRAGWEAAHSGKH